MQYGAEGHSGRLPRVCVGMGGMPFSKPPENGFLRDDLWSCRASACPGLRPAEGGALRCLSERGVGGRCLRRVIAKAFVAGDALFLKKLLPLRGDARIGKQIGDVLEIGEFGK